MTEKEFKLIDGFVDYALSDLETIKKLKAENEKLKKENKELWEYIAEYNLTFASVERKKADLIQEHEKLKKEKEQIKHWIVDKIKYLDKGVFLMSYERVKGAIEILNELLKEVLGE